MGVEPVDLRVAADRAMLRGDRQRAADLLERYVLSPGSTADDFVRLASVRRALGDLVGATAAIQQAIDRDPRHFLALLMGGSLLLAMGRDEEAARTYEAALRQMPAMRAVPPALQVERARAQAHIEAVASWRGAVARSDWQGLPAEQRARLADYRAGLLERGDKAAFQGLAPRGFCDPADVPGLAALAAATPIVLAEFEALVRTRAPELVSQLDHGVASVAPEAASRRWSAIHLYRDGALVAENAALCPQTLALYEALRPPRIAGRAPNLMFSLLDPHARIPPHVGTTNTRLTMHLPLVIPEACGIRVAGETRRWTMGEPLLFDDTCEHEAWNDSDALRVVLLGDVWRPELEPQEREAVAGLLGK